MANCELIPGLPNDLALLCLVRLPSECISRMKLVSSLWKIALEGDRFYIQRRLLFSLPSIFLVRSFHQRCQCLDIDYADITSSRVLFSCDLQLAHTLFPHPSVCASFGESVVVAGGKGRQVSSATDVHVFNILTRKWTPASMMLSSRSRILYASLGRRLFVLGSDDKDGAISTEAEVYDHTKDLWSPIKSPPSSSVYDLCFPFQDKLIVRGRGRTDMPFSTSAYSFDPLKNQWEEELELRNRLDGLSEGSKVVATPDGTLLVSKVEENSRNVELMLQRSGGPWTHIAKIPITGSGNIFFFSEGEKAVLLMPTNSGKLERRQFPFFPRLSFISVPCSELHLATFIYCN